MRGSDRPETVLDRLGSGDRSQNEPFVGTRRRAPTPSRCSRLPIRAGSGHRAPPRDSACPASATRRPNRAQSFDWRHRQSPGDFDWLAARQGVAFDQDICRHGCLLRLEPFAFGIDEHHAADGRLMGPIRHRHVDRLPFKGTTAWLRPRARSNGRVPGSSRRRSHGRSSSSEWRLPAPLRSARPLRERPWDRE